MDIRVPPTSSLSSKQMQVLTALVAGEPITAAAAAIGVHRTTVHYWCRRHPEFRLALQDAQQAQADAVRDQLSQLAGSGLSVLREILESESVPQALRLKAALAVVSAASSELPAHRPIPVDRMNGDQLDLFFDAVYLAAEREIRASRDRHQLDSPPDAAPQAPVSRNAPCPCGSGEKFKRCCGHNAPPNLQSGVSAHHLATQCNTSSVSNL